MRAAKVAGIGTAILNAWSGGQLITHSFRFEPLPNGLIRVENRTAGLMGTWTPDGQPNGGDCGGIFDDEVSLVVRVLYGPVPR